jgi:4-hydroxyphenylpyruvate dioxygenase
MLEPLGLRRLEAIQYYVRDLQRSRRFYTGMLDFAETWRTSPKAENGASAESACFSAGDIQVVCTTPIGTRGRATRFLSKHPDGVGALIFEVEDIDKAFARVEERGGTPIDDIQQFETDRGTLRTFSVTTPFSDCLFRFRQHSGNAALFADAVPVAAGASNRFGFQTIDHVTSNFQTMKPVLLWLEHVMGFEKMWEIQFHTSDVAPDHHLGSGLKSVVMWDPRSQIKFACNEPARPHFRNSQIHLFNEELRGDGVQHVALSVTDLIAAVRSLRSAGVSFMPTPDAYYDLLPDRLVHSGLMRIDEDIAVLRELGVLVDGERLGEYLLQIFLKESAGYYGDSSAGPFFYELIQRKGDQGFGAGNFRALFESIEREQRGRGST